MPFCLSFKDYDGAPVRVNEQKDVNEFANMLFDKLESSSRDAGAVIKDTFGGVLVNQIISQEGNFTSERQEPFNMITLTVQGKASLVESFDTLVAGDLLTGDNKYQLPDGSKVRCNTV